jgi:broad specificity phosphatase PhoE
MVSWDAVLATILASFADPQSEAALALAALLRSLAYIGRPRRIYFVRHGQTEANAKRIRQDDKGPLSATGRAQAKATAAYLARFPIKAMVASPYERATETAHILNETLKVPLAFSPLLAERRNPTEIVGRRDDDPAVVKIVDQIDRAYHDDDFRYSDEENFADLRDRARRLLHLLSHQSATHLVAVTHGIYLKMVIAYLLNRHSLHAGDYAKLSFFNASDNAGITICEFEPLKRFNRTRGWRVIEYNITPSVAPVAAQSLRGAPRIPAPIS